MPAGIPPSGLDRRFILGDRLLRNSGADTSVNYQAAARSRASGDFLIAGNNDYVGLMQGGLWGELVQGVSLPPTSNTMRVVVENQGFGGWIILDAGNSVFRGPADLVAPWTDITPPPVTSRQGVVEYQGRIFVATNSLAAPSRDIEFSDDNGATWDDDPGIFTGIVNNLFGIYTNPAQNRLVAIATGGASAAFSTDDLGEVWTIWPLVTGGAMNDCAISDDGTKAVIVGPTGQIHVTDGFGTFTSIPVDENPFRSTAGTGSAITSVVYVAQLAGFVLLSSTGPSMGFIAESNMEVVIIGSYLGGPIAFPVRNAVSDGEQAMFPGNSNEAVMTLRNVGQLGRT